jgi:hypothetical protein
VPKCQFFAWPAALGKAPTANNLAKKNWPCDPQCALCFCELETSDHLLTTCNFTEAVWDMTAQSFNLHPTVFPFQKGNIGDWLHSIDRAGTKKQQLKTVGIMFFFWWGIWKERNRRIFNQEEHSFL